MMKIGNFQHAKNLRFLSMKKILFILCIVFLFLAACSPKTGNEVTGLVTLEDYGSEDSSEKTEDKTEVVEKTIEDEPEEDPSETANFKEEVKIAIEEVKETVVNPTVRNLLTKSEDIKSYGYLYGGPETAGYFKDTYVCLGSDCSTMVLQYYKGEEYVREGYSDTVYISDTETVGCCLDVMRCFSNNVDNRNKLFEIDRASLVIPKTPVEWLKLFGEMNAELIGKSTFDNRGVEDFVFSDEKYTYRVKLDERFGIPHLIEQFEGDKKINKFQFNDFVFNGWKEGFFIPPCKQLE